MLLLFFTERSDLLAVDEEPAVAKYAVGVIHRQDGHMFNQCFHIVRSLSFFAFISFASDGCPEFRKSFIALPPVELDPARHRMSGRGIGLRQMDGVTDDRRGRRRSR